MPRSPSPPRALRAAVLSMALLLSACSGSGATAGVAGDGGGAAGDDAAGGPGAPPAALADYCARYVELTCRAAAACGCLDGLAASFCDTYQAAECREDVEDPVASGRVGYDAAEGGRCLAGIEAIIADCSLDGDDEPDACDAMLVGQQGPGDPCDDSDECTPGTECDGEACAAVPQAGEACGADGRCASEHFCGADDRCHPYRAAGEPCADEPSQCDGDLYCSPATRRCAPYPGEGQGCADSGGTCAEGRYCDAEDVCRAQGGAGAPCAAAAECRSDDCAAGRCREEPEDGCPFL